MFDLSSFLTEQTHEETKELISMLVNDVMSFRSFVHERVQASSSIDVFDRFALVHYCRSTTVVLSNCPLFAHAQVVLQENARSSRAVPTVLTPQAGWRSQRAGH